MDHLYKLMAMLVFVGLLTAGCTKTNQAQSTKIIDVKKVNNIWKVDNVQPDVSGPMHVKAGDTVVWRSDSSDVVFQFPEDASNKYFNPVAPDDSLEEGYLKKMKAGEELRLKVKDDVKKGRIIYAVFVIKPAVFARGSTPPIIIIDG